MTRLEFPEPPVEPKKKIERLAFGETAPTKRLFSDTPADPMKVFTDEIKYRFPLFTPQQISYATNLVKQLVPIKESSLTEFGLRAQEAQAEFISKLTDHTKKMELGEVAKLIAKAVEAANKPKSLIGRLMHEPVADWSSYKALGLHLQTTLDSIKSSMTFISNELTLQKDRLPVHLAALSVVLDLQLPSDPVLLQLADSRQRALTFGVQQAGLLQNQVKQMNVTLTTTQENLSTFMNVTLPALEFKDSLNVTCK
jgi:hypothetical protein